MVLNKLYLFFILIIPFSLNAMNFCLGTTNNLHNWKSLSFKKLEKTGYIPLKGPGPKEAWSEDGLYFALWNYESHFNSQFKLASPKVQDYKELFAAFAEAHSNNNPAMPTSYLQNLIHKINVHKNESSIENFHIVTMKPEGAWQKLAAMVDNTTTYGPRDYNFQHSFSDEPRRSFLFRPFHHL